jgi:hypothetical protein
VQQFDVQQAVCSVQFADTVANAVIASAVIKSLRMVFTSFQFKIQR